MKRFFPFFLVAAFSLIVFAVVFAVTHPTILPSGVKALDWRKLGAITPELPEAPEIV